MKKHLVLRRVMAMAVSSVLLCTMALTASADYVKEPGDDHVVAIAVSAPQFTNYPKTAKYLGLLFHRAM